MIAGFYICIGWLLVAIGMCGCVIPLIPGAADCLLLTARCESAWRSWNILRHVVPSNATLLLTAGITIVVTVLDYIVPVIGAKRFKCSRLGTIGCTVGTVIGLFYFPFGVVAGPILGALIGESVSGKNLAQASLGAIGSFVGFLFGVIMKLSCCAYIAYCFYQTVK